MAQNNRRGRSGRRRSGGQGGNNPNRSIDSQGPEVKIRGNAQQVYDKYTALARDAFSAGDRIRGESLQQHAEHYYRMLQAMKPPEPKEQPRADDRQQGTAQDEAKASEDAQSKDTAKDQDAAANEQESKDRAQDGEEKPERKPRRERKPRKSDAAAAQATELPLSEKADPPSDRAGVEKEGHEAPEASSDEEKPRRRRRTRRKAEDEESEPSASEKASVA